jgi:hypothetical protein
MRVACQGLNRDFGISVQGSVRDVNYTAKLGDIEVSIPVLSRDTNTPRIEAPCYPSTSHCWHQCCWHPPRLNHPLVFVRGWAAPREPVVAQGMWTHAKTAVHRCLIS